MCAIKVKNHSTNRIIQKQVKNAGTVDQDAPPPGGCLRPGAFSSQDRASLSDHTRLQSKAQVTRYEAPEARTDRLDQLRRQIAAGSFEVPAEALARRLLSKLKDLSSDE